MERRSRAWSVPPALPVVLLAAGVALPWLTLAIPGAAAAAFLAAGLAVATGTIFLARAARRAAIRGDAFAAALQDLARGGTPARSLLPDAENPDALADEVSKRLQSLEADAMASEGVLDALEVPVIAVNSRGAVVSANRAASAFLAPGAGVGIVGRELGELLPDQQAIQVVRGAQGGVPSRGRVRLLTVDGPRIVEVAAEPILGAGGASRPTAAVTLRDITEQATALQLKTDFVANASHELRTPLASIKTAAETLADLGDESPPMRARLVSMIASNAERLEELARDLLDLSSLESPEAECIITDVDAFLVGDELASLFETSCAQRRVSLEFALDGALHNVRTDGKLLRLVLRNLIDNAIKFAYEDTTVLVRGVSGTWSQPAPGRLDARFEVIDQGIGIPLSQQQRIFERFFQVDSARSGTSPRRGTGLGLAIVKHALRAIGGTIQVKSVWQQGTTMVIDIPGCVEATPLTTPAG